MKEKANSFREIILKELDKMHDHREDAIRAKIATVERELEELNKDLMHAVEHRKFLAQNLRKIRVEELPAVELLFTGYRRSISLESEMDGKDYEVREGNAYEKQ